MSLLQLRLRLLPLPLLIPLLLLTACAQPEPERPEDAVLAMFEAARTGDVPAYLDGFDGNIRATLEKNVADMGEDAFKDYLIQTNDPIVGIAVSDVEPFAADRVTLRVELVYRNKNEIQTYTLLQQNMSWKIMGMSRATRIKTIVPYGQKVFELAPDTVAQSPPPSQSTTR